MKLLVARFHSGAAAGAGEEGQEGPAAAERSGGGNRAEDGQKVAAERCAGE